MERSDWSTGGSGGSEATAAAREAPPPPVATGQELGQVAAGDAEFENIFGAKLPIGESRIPSSSEQGAIWRQSVADITAYLYGRSPDPKNFKYDDIGELLVHLATTQLNFTRDGIVDEAIKLCEIIRDEKELPYTGIDTQDGSMAEEALQDIEEYLSFAKSLCSPYGRIALKPCHMARDVATGIKTIYQRTLSDYEQLAVENHDFAALVAAEVNTRMEVQSKRQWPRGEGLQARLEADNIRTEIIGNVLKELIADGADDSEIKLVRALYVNNKAISLERQAQRTFGAPKSSGAISLGQVVGLYDVTTESQKQVA